MSAVTVLDAAKYILEQQPGPITAMKLQKLCFYAQSWHAALADGPLFDDEFQAWANGPVCYTLFDAHRGKFNVVASDFAIGDATKVSAQSAAIIDKVLEAYAGFSGHELSQMTHAESPWRNARKGLPSGASSTEVIPLDSMARHCREQLARA